MAVPLAIASLATSLVGTGITAYNQYQQGKTQQKILERNAKQRELDAATRQKETLAQAREKRIENRKLLARKMVGFGGRGLELEGTPLDILAEDAAYLERGAIEIERFGEKDYLSMVTQAGMDRYKGKSVARAGRLGAAGTVMQGFSQAAESYAGYKRSGVFSAKGII
jgi:hypothetical protein